MNYIFRTALLALVTLSLIGCPQPPKPDFGIPTLASALGPEWVAVPLPDSKLTPGAVVQIVPVDARTIDLRWIGSLQESCQVPATALSVQQGDVPSVKTGKQYSFNFNVSATLQKWGVSAQANYDPTATLTITTAKDYSLDLLKFKAWLAVPANAAMLKQNCGSSLSDKQVYVVQEAFVISDGALSLQTQGKAGVGLTTPSTAPVKANADASGNSTNDLTVTKPIVFALHRIQQVSDGQFATLGDSAPTAASPTSPLAGKTIRDISTTPPK